MCAPMCASNVDHTGASFLTRAVSMCAHGAESCAGLSSGDETIGRLGALKPSLFYPVLSCHFALLLLLAGRAGLDHVGYG